MKSSSPVGFLIRCCSSTRCVVLEQGSTRRGHREPGSQSDAAVPESHLASALKQSASGSGAALRISAHPRSNSTTSCAGTASASSAVSLFVLSHAGDHPTTEPVGVPGNLDRQRDLDGPVRNAKEELGFRPQGASITAPSASTVRGRPKSLSAAASAVIKRNGPTKLPSTTAWDASNDGVTAAFRAAAAPLNK